MAPPRWSPASQHTPRALALVLGLAGAGCGAVPDDPGPRLVAGRGVIRGTLVYQGPRPCSRAGHIVGSAVLLVFDARDPPPPDGFATTAVNFVAVTGDVLFGDEPRFTGDDVYCPARSGFTETITASAPFVIAPIANGGSYEIRAFYDVAGDFLPEFSIRDLPEQGDVAGGDIDPAEALAPANVGNPNYRPSFLPIPVGVAAPAGSGGGYVIPAAGFVADNVTVTIGAPVALSRPYFYAQGEAVAFDPTTMGLETRVSQSSDRPPADTSGVTGTTATDPNTTPVLTIPQDIGVLAPPTALTPAGIDFYEASFPHLILPWGLPAAELAHATASPFDLPIAPFGATAAAGFAVWQDALLDAATGAYEPQVIPEGTVPQLWPRVVLSRQPAPGEPPDAPLVLLQGITLLAGTTGADSILGTVLAGAGGALFQGSGTARRPVVALQDHLTVVLRPSVICLPAPGATGAITPGLLVTPHPLGPAADVDCSSGTCAPAMPDEMVPIAPASALESPSLAALVSGPPVAACLPLGRYAVSVLYPDGQAWSVPNEAGVCAAAEGATDDARLTCAVEPRPVLYSQGARAVVEIVAASDPAACAGASAVPRECSTSR